MNDLTAPVPAPTGPMPFLMLLDEAMRRVRRHFRAIYPAVAIPLVLVTTATAALQALWFKRLVSAGVDQPPTFSFETIIMGLLQLILLVIGIMALQKATVDAVAGRPIDMKAAWRFGARPAVLGTIILQGLAIMASALACFFPVLYVAPLLSLVGPIMVEENLLGGRALSRSAELTRYNPRGLFTESPLVKAFALFFVAAIISYAVAALVALAQIPLWINFWRQAAAGQEPDLGALAQILWIQIPLQALQMLVNVAVYLYSSFGFALLFFDTRNRKEGTDLAAEIGAVFGQPIPGQSTPPGDPAS